jgi:translation initiation factor IF-2
MQTYARFLALAALAAPLWVHAQTDASLPPDYSFRPLTGPQGPAAGAAAPTPTPAPAPQPAQPEPAAAAPAASADAPEPAPAAPPEPAAEAATAARPEAPAAPAAQPPRSAYGPTAPPGRPGYRGQGPRWGSPYGSGPYGGSSVPEYVEQRRRDALARHEEARQRAMERRHRPWPSRGPYRHGGPHRGYGPYGGYGDPMGYPGPGYGPAATPYAAPARTDGDGGSPAGG